MFYRETIVNAIRLLKGGGLLLMTMASYGRPEHGIYGSAAFASPHIELLRKCVPEGCRPFGEWEQQFPLHLSMGECQTLFYGIKRS
jgi:hypothetical protein